MLEIGLELLLFSGKLFIFLIFILLLLICIIALLSHGKDKTRGRICIKNMNKKLIELSENLKEEILSKKSFKKYLKEKKLEAKKKQSDDTTKKNIFVLTFDGDVKASAIASLREEVTAVLGIASTQDEVVVRVESPGGVVHGYGLAAAQLLRIREKQIPLIVIVDKVAASGGYLMATVANKILAAPFAILGSIGVIFQLPNFHRFLQEKNIDFEQVTAGSFKRTLTMFGENTPEKREKVKQEIEEIHHLFKNLIQKYRPHIEIEKVSTGEYWLGEQALQLNLIDGISTSDSYLYSHLENANIYEICYLIKKSFGEKLSSAISTVYQTMIQLIQFNKNV